MVVQVYPDSGLGKARIFLKLFSLEYLLTNQIYYFDLFYLSIKHILKLYY